MKNSQLLTLLSETQMSPEQLALRLGISGMTIRRWLEHPSHPLPKLYKNALRDATYELFIEGVLDGTSTSMKTLLSEETPISFEVAIKNLGFTEKSKKITGNSDNRLLAGLAEIGASPKRQDTIARSKKKLLSFKKLSSDWAFRIDRLVQVARSKNILSTDKWVAIGALFYLLTPFDLIPDYIPVFGLVDDFGVLGLAVAYYANRFPDSKN